MMPIFATPLALFALASLPALAAIYWLRHRHRREVVSSLMLWAEAAAAREGGSRVQRFRPPVVLLLLELLALLAMVLGAAGPHTWRGSVHQPLVVVLDDSYSMRAGDENSARALAERALVKELASGRYVVTVVLAGATPQVLTGATINASRVREDLRAGWSCGSPRADLGAGLALAAEVGGPGAQWLVLTDHAPPADESFAGGRLRWWAFGQPRGNVAFAGASRADAPRTGGARCMVEVANLSGTATEAVVTLGPLDAAKRGAVKVQRVTLPLAANGRRAQFFDLPGGAGAVVVTLGDDALAADNRVVLLPEPRRVVHVGVAVQDSELRSRIVRALDAVPGAEIATRGEDLRITDGAVDSAVAPAGRWTLRIDAGGEPRAYVGPFVVDRSHPLTEGLSLDGVIWGAGEMSPSEGDAGDDPVVMAGNAVLVRDRVEAGGGHTVTMRLVRGLSTLDATPDWPIFFWNLLAWRADHLPGPRRVNVRVGDAMRVTLGAVAAGSQVHVTDPAGGGRAVAASETVSIPATRAGVWEVRGEGRDDRFAANELDARESDLRPCATGQWGAWSNGSIFHAEYGSIAWAACLAALALLCMEQVLVWRASREGGERL